MIYKEWMRILSEEDNGRNFDKKKKVENGTQKKTLAETLRKRERMRMLIWRKHWQKY